jgi:hypothetical protein
VNVKGNTGASRVTLFIVVIIVWLSFLTLVALFERPVFTSVGILGSVTSSTVVPSNKSESAFTSTASGPLGIAAPSFRIVRVVMTSSYLFLSVVNNGSVPISSVIIGIAMIGNATPVIPNYTDFPTISNTTPLEPGSEAWVNTTFFAPLGSGISDTAAGAYYIVVQAQYKGSQSFVQIEVNVER